MKIIKKYQGTAPDNKIVNTQTTSQTDTYSCDFINDTIWRSNDSKYINKDTYVGDTGKQLKDIKTNADNISSLNSGKEAKINRGSNAIDIPGNQPTLVAVKVFSTYSDAGGVGIVLGGYDIKWIYNTGLNVSRSGSRYSITSSYGACYIAAISLW